MEIQVSFTSCVVEEPDLPLASGAGSQVEFRGVVRGMENGAPIAALQYDIYPQMAEKVIRDIVGDLAGTNPCLRVIVIHRHGTIPVGEVAIYMRVDSAHRGEGFRMLEEFMNRLKKDVPIWKVGSVPC
jgi:molybdopterin synthase catalytic subunit